MSVTEETVSAEAIDRLAAEVRGPVLREGDDGYDAARAVWNGLIDRRPARHRAVHRHRRRDRRRELRPRREPAVCRCAAAGTTSPATPSTTAASSPTCRCMRGVHVDPATGRVHVQGGATWADADREAQLHGLAVPGGVVSTTGVAGLTLHGGMGHLRRKYGLTIDSLVSAEIVTADGQLRHASADENADLFWAIRGAGSNFGAVTSFEFQGRKVGPEVAVAAVFYPLEQGKQVLTRWRDTMAGMPDEVSSLAIVWSVPPGDPFPAEHHGQRRRHRRGRPLRHAGRGRADRPAAARARRSADRHQRPVAVARTAERVRRAVPVGRPALLEVARARRADRRGDRHRRSTSAAGARRRSPTSSSGTRAAR